MVKIIFIMKTFQDFTIEGSKDNNLKENEVHLSRCDKFESEFFLSFFFFLRDFF